MVDRFIGREKEMESLIGLSKKKIPSLVVIRGRRRIGKSRLCEEYAKTFSRSIILTGIPPVDGVTAEEQRAEFLRQLQEYDLPIYRSDDWGNLFHDLSEKTKKGRILIVLDEITWMGSKDPTFMPKLKTAWDRHFKKNNKLILIITGSNSTWIQKNILSSTGFYGRVSLRILLKELPIADCNVFWEDWPGIIAPYEKFKILAVTGGIPRYLEELRPDLSAEANIQRMCFDSEGLLFQEFDQIFHDLFRNKGNFYKQIVETLVDNRLSATQIASELGCSTGGDFSDSLDELTQAGFIARDYIWSFAKKTKSTTSRYRLSDNYLRFYLKYIQPNREQIEEGKVRKLPTGWYSILGLQFENLVVNNGDILQNLLGIPTDEVIFAAPYLQTPQTRRKGCQIDYLIQTRFNCIYICEVKFMQGKIGIEVVNEVQEKQRALQLPRGFSCRPVLIHVNGVDEKVEDCGFFARIVDFSEFLGGR
ncbi:MAG: AAA family ATPase [Verrucomicrobia bacterium]|nr:AAA family ATPase [Verrucomicrobiota bacterium]